MEQRLSQVSAALTGGGNGMSVRTDQGGVQRA